MYNEADTGEITKNALQIFWTFWTTEVDRLCKILTFKVIFYVKFFLIFLKKNIEHHLRTPTFIKNIISKIRSQNSDFSKSIYFIRKTSKKNYAIFVILPGLIVLSFHQIPST